MFTNGMFVLRLRCRQLGRLFLTGGWRLWVLLPVVMFLVVATVRDATRWSMFWWNASLVFLLLSVDWQRGDKKFLALLPASGYLLRWTEYTLILLLANSYALTLGSRGFIYFCAGVLILSCGMLLTGNKKINFRFPLSRQLTSLLPLRRYAIKSGFRQAFLFLTLLWAVTLVMCWHLPVLSFAVFLLLTMLLGALLQPEPVTITQSQQTLQRALNRNILAEVAVFMLLLLPHFIISIWHFHDLAGWISFILSLWLLIVCVTYAVLLRYSQEPETSLVFSALKLSFVLLVSPLAPVAVYFIYQEYKRARCRLQSLLN